MSSKHENSKSQDELASQAMLWIVRLNSGTSNAKGAEDYKNWRALSLEHEKAANEAQNLWDTMSALEFEPKSGFIKLQGNRSGVSRRDVLLGMAGLGTFGALSYSPWASSLYTRMLADYSTAVASQRQVSLPDGSRAVLNARSAIDVKFGDLERRVILRQGQAYFEVAPEQRLPFEVFVDDISITALGTKFDITRGLPDVAAEISVVEHAVRVSVISGPLKASVDVAEGHRVSVENTGMIGAIRQQDSTVTAAWRDGIYIAEERSLREVVAALSDWHQGVILIASPSLNSLRINTVLDLKDPIGSLDALQAGLPIRVRHASGYLTIISAA